MPSRVGLFIHTKGQGFFKFKINSLNVDFASQHSVTSANPASREKEKAARKRELNCTLISVRENLVDFGDNKTFCIKYDLCLTSFRSNPGGGGGGVKRTCFS